MRSVALLVGLLGATACSSDDDVDLDAIRGGVQIECGTIANGPSPACSTTADAPTQCFVTALQQCTPARLVVGQTFDDSGFEVELFVVARDGGCDVVAVSQNRDGFPPEGTSGREMVVSRCETAAPATTAEGCPSVAPAECVVVSTSP